ncbi:MAG: hypothetical protein ABI026_10560 [Gemmatimonadaceae bacterium]
MSRELFGRTDSRVISVNQKLMNATFKLTMIDVSIRPYWLTDGSKRSWRETRDGLDMTCD